MIRADLDPAVVPMRLSALREQPSRESCATRLSGVPVPQRTANQAAGGLRALMIHVLDGAHTPFART
jgi:hypothetical protein